MPNRKKEEMHNNRINADRQQRGGFSALPSALSWLHNKNLLLSMVASGDAERYPLRKMIKEIF